MGQKQDIHLVRLSQAGSEAILKVCARCHRSEEMINRQSSQVNLTNRFQGYGLQQSRCYKESQGRLSCVTCHNPHQNAQESAHAYEAACLKCHSAAPREGAALQKAAGVCPVNPSTNCIPCHMPSRSVSPGTDLPTRMADHYIRIYPEKSGVKALRR